MARLAASPFMQNVNFFIIPLKKKKKLEEKPLGEWKKWKGNRFVVYWVFFFFFQEKVIPRVAKLTHAGEICGPNFSQTFIMVASERS